MNFRKIVRFIGFVLILLSVPFPSAGEDFTNAIHAYLQQYVHAERINGCIVVGLVDAHGKRVVACGKLDNGTDQEANGDTVFSLCSTTGIFTDLLLQSMVERGEMKLDDPVAKCLPKSVKVPIYHGKKITLRDLVRETSGLPHSVPYKLDPKRADNPFNDFTVEKIDAFVSGSQLINAPGTKHFHGGVDLGLLGQAMALKAGTDYASLMIDRICRPLKMDSTRFALTPELKSRLATEYDECGYAVPSWDWGVMRPLAGLYSTANDLLKFMSANLGLTPSSLTPLMEKALLLSFKPPEGDIVYIPGIRACYSFDKMQRRGVVVLSSSFDWPDLGNIDKFLLESKWQSDKRPKETRIGSQVYDSYVGQYRLISDAASRRFKLWPFPHFKGGTTPQSSIGIYREGRRLFARVLGSRSWPADLLLPPVAGELLPESETRFFERLSGRVVTFSQDGRGNVTGLTMHYLGNVFFYKRISEEPPKPTEPPWRPTIVKLDTKLLDACVGHYQFAPSAVFSTGMTLTIWREGDQLVGQARGAGEYFLHGAFDIYPQSETVFFDKLICSQLTFIKNDRGQVITVIIHIPGRPDCEGERLK